MITADAELIIDDVVTASGSIDTAALSSIVTLRATVPVGYSLHE